MQYLACPHINIAHRVYEALKARFYQLPPYMVSKFYEIFCYVGASF